MRRIERDIERHLQPAFRCVTHVKAVRRWVDQIASLIEEGHEEGSIPRSVSSQDAAERLTGIVDSMGERWMIGRLSIERARSLIREAVRIELGPR